MTLDILAFAAHPDDVELSASGTLLHYAAQGKKIGIIDLTEGELGTRGSVADRYAESAAAGKLMGLTVRKNLNMGDGFFEINEENKRKIVEQIRIYQPEIVLANCLNDRHPDHGRGGKLVSDACFLAGLRKIETIVDGVSLAPHRPRLVLHYIQDHYAHPDIVMDVTPYMEQKIEVVKVYFVLEREYQTRKPHKCILERRYAEYDGQTGQKQGAIGEPGKQTEMLETQI